MATLTPQTAGRKQGSKNRGYFYRSGRGWHARKDGKYLPLYDESGNRIMAPEAEVAAALAYAREKANWGKPAPSKVVTVADCVHAFLQWEKRNSRETTYKIRLRYLYDLATGFSVKWKDSAKKATPADRIHAGLGDLPAKDLTVKHIEDWVVSHRDKETDRPHWGGGTRTAKQSVLRCFNKCADLGVIPANPIKRLKLGKIRRRLTFLTDQQIEALLRHCKPDVAEAFQILLRLGCRPGCEFSKVQKRHVQIDDEGRMSFLFGVTECKTGSRNGEEREITVPSDVAAKVRELVVKYPEGPIFRQSDGRPWSIHLLGDAFRRAKKAAQKEGVVFDSHCCLYSFRHTFAKRVLAGHWGGPPASMATLAGLLGCSPKIAEDTYGKKCRPATKHFYDVLGDHPSGSQLPST